MGWFSRMKKLARVRAENDALRARNGELMLTLNRLRDSLTAAQHEAEAAGVVLWALAWDAGDDHRITVRKDTAEMRGEGGAIDFALIPSLGVYEVTASKCDTGPAGLSSSGLHVVGEGANDDA